MSEQIRKLTTSINLHNDTLQEKIDNNPLDTEAIILSRLMSLELKQLEELINLEYRTYQKEGLAKEAECFNITSGNLIISDPCYEISSGHQCFVTNAKKGLWKQFLYGTTKFGGYSITQQVCCHEKYFFDAKHFSWQELGIVSVDSGQAGIFDRDFYMNPSVCEGYRYKYTPIRPAEIWYSCVSDNTQGPRRGGAVPFGCVSVSGFGDGKYLCSVITHNNEVIAVKIDYLSDEGECV